jgi:hypothetical protein
LNGLKVKQHKLKTWVAAMKKLTTISITISALLVAAMIFAFQLPPSNNQHIVFAKEQSKSTKADVTVTPEISNIKNALSREASPTAPQPFISNESITATLLLLCTGLVGLVGISRKNKN